MTILSSMVIMSPAQADQCLSQFPDSAWSQDYPQNLPIGKDILLISSKSTYTNGVGQAVNRTWEYKTDKNLENGIYHPLSDTFFGNSQTSISLNVKRDTVLKVEFTYAGASCSTRTVSTVWPFLLTELTAIEKSDPKYPTLLPQLFNEENKQNLTKSLNFIAVKYLDQGLLDFVKSLDESKLAPLDSKVLIANNEIESYWALVSLYEKQGIKLYGGTNYSGALMTYWQIKEISPDNCITLQGDGWGYAGAKFNSSPKICRLIVLGKTTQGQWLHLGDRYISNPNFKASTSAGNNAKQSSKQVVINCKKGSVTKQVKALNPKCPAGFTKQ